MYVYEKVLCHGEVRSIVQELDELHSAKGPFNTIEKLALLGSKCRNVSKLLWTVQITKLALDTEELDVGEFSVPKLAPRSGKAGLLDVMLMKKSIKDFLLGPFLDKRPAMQPQVKEAVRRLFASADTYSVQYRQADKTFAASWPASASQLLDLIETSVYTFSGNEVSSIRMGLKNGKTGQDLPSRPMCGSCGGWGGCWGSQRAWEDKYKMIASAKAKIYSKPALKPKLKPTILRWALSYWGDTSELSATLAAGDPGGVRALQDPRCGDGQEHGDRGGRPSNGHRGRRQ